MDFNLAVMATMLGVFLAAPQFKELVDELYKVFSELKAAGLEAEVLNLTDLMRYGTPEEVIAAVDELFDKKAQQLKCSVEEHERIRRLIHDLP